MTQTQTSQGPVLVIGSTGTQGGAVAGQLLDAGFQVRAAARHPERAAHLAARGAETIQLDLADADSVRRAADGARFAFFHQPMSLGGPGAGERLREAIDALVAAGVERIVYNTGGPTPDAPVGNPMADGRVHLVKQVLGTGVGTVLKPTGYMENFSAPWSARKVAGGELVYPLPAEARNAWITNQDVGRYTAAALRTPASVGQAYAIAGPEVLDFPGIAERLSRAVGHPVVFRRVSGAEYGELMVPFLGEQLGRAIGAGYDHMPTGPNPLLTPDIRPAVEALGVEPTPLEDWARTQDWGGTTA